LHFFQLQEIFKNDPPIPYSFFLFLNDNIKQSRLQKNPKTSYPHQTSSSPAIICVGFVLFHRSIDNSSFSLLYKNRISKFVDCDRDCDWNCNCNCDLRGEPGWISRSYCVGVPIGADRAKKGTGVSIFPHKISAGRQKTFFAFVFRRIFFFSFAAPLENLISGISISSCSSTF